MNSLFFTPPAVTEFTNGCCLECHAHSKPLLKKFIPVLEQASIKPRIANCVYNTNALLQQLSDFDLILHEPLMCFGFNKYLHLVFSSENLFFWKEIEYFKQLPPTHPDLLQISQEIFDKYLAPDSQIGINVSHQNKLAVEKQLREKTVITPSLFNYCQNEVYYLMKNDRYTLFLKHDIFTETVDLVRRIKCYDYVMPQSQQIVLSDRDFGLLFSQAEHFACKPNDILLKEGDMNKYLFHLVSGSLRVEKNIQGRNVVLTTIHDNRRFFGEMSALGKLGKATASIIAEEDCVVNRILIDDVSYLFRTQVELGKKFYLYIINNLSGVLKNLSSLTIDNNSAKTITPTGNSSEEQREDAFFVKQFKLSEPQYLLHKMQCNLVLSRGIGTVKGTIFISQDFCCFLVKIFGKKIKTIIPLKHITKVETKEDKYTVHYSKSRVVKFSLVDPADADVISTILVARMDLCPSSNDERSKSPERELSPVARRFSLSNSDWDILFKGNMGKSFLQFFKNDAILTEGEKVRMICQISSGTCRIEKKHPTDENVSIVIGRLGPGEIFGEINFCTNGTASATVIADSFVELYFIDAEYLHNEVFPKDPHLVLRFYSYICSVLTKRIVERESEGWGPS